MSVITDNLIAYKILYMLVTPFAATNAYKLGIIDENGKNLIKPSKLSSEQKDEYTYLHRLVFNMKRILAKLPGGDNRLKSFVAALYLIKEYYTVKDKAFDLMEDRFNSIIKANVILAEETILVEKFKPEDYCDACDRLKKDCICDKEVNEDGAPTNSTGVAVSTDKAVIKNKDVKNYKKKNVSALTFVKRLNKKL